MKDLRFRYFQATVLTALAGALLSGCGHSTAAGVRADQDAALTWPDADRARPIVKDSVFPQVAAFDAVSEGTSKLEVYRALGHPMYHEGLVGVREWNYVFNLPAGEIDAYLECQYKVRFDEDNRVSSTHWLPERCAKLVAPKARGPVLADAVDLSADALFDFDSAHLQERATKVLDSYVKRLLGARSSAKVLRVTGYTDRFGNESHNRELSQARAQAVKAYLVTHGLPANAITVEGRGSSDPLVHCVGRKTPAVVECLKPNRRVRIEAVDAL